MGTLSFLNALRPRICRPLVVGGPRQQDKGRPGKWFGTANDRARYGEQLQAAGETIAIPA